MNKTLLNFLTSFIPSKKWRNLTRKMAVMDGFGLHLLKRPTKTRLFLCQDQNFGDMLNHNLMHFFGYSYEPAPVWFAQMCAIGSLLEGILNSPKNLTTKRPLHIWGSGFIEKPSFEHELPTRPLYIHALRGKLSRARLERMLNLSLHNVPLGDPGLLIRRIFPNISTQKKYDVGIICHMADTPESLKNKLRLVKHSCTYIDVTQSPETFVQQVAQCKFILSSAMHGLICADSLGIPNAHIILSNNVNGGQYKFQDYYSAFHDITYTPIDLQKHTICDSDIDRLINNYEIKSEEIEDICNRLIEAFPHHLFV